MGKSVNIKARVKSHFENAKLDAKERAIVENSAKIETIPTESEFKALLFESELIQKYHPKYNSIWKDDKSYLYVKITVGEEYPKIHLVRRSDIDAEKFKIQNSRLQCLAATHGGQANLKIKTQKLKTKGLYFGPFGSKRTLEQLLREIRRVIPFCTAKNVTTRPCFYSKIGFCNPCPNVINAISVEGDLRVVPMSRERATLDKPGGLSLRTQGLKQKYLKQINQIIHIFEGKTEIVLKDLRRKMNCLSKEKKYEEAMVIRNRIASFENLITNSRFDNSSLAMEQFNNKTISKNTESLKKILTPYFAYIGDLKKIECYDVSNLNFKEGAAAMSVAVDGQIDKGEYRKFNVNAESGIRNLESGKNHKNLDSRFKIQDSWKVDWEFMHSILLRRFKHTEWQFPNLLVVDGGKPQVMMAIKCMKELKLNIPAIGIAKNPDRLVIGVADMLTIRPALNNPGFNLVRLLRDEAHRFGKKYHLLLRSKNLTFSV